MDPKESIFDKTFDTQILIRRRALIPFFFKIYVWALMSIGLFALIIFSLAVVSPEMAAIGIVDPVFAQPLYALLGVAIMSVVFLLGLSLWLEAKWAVRFNLVFAVLWVGKAFYTFVSTGMTRGDIVVAALILFPFWTKLRRIQKTWEQNAVKGKQAKVLS